MLPSYSVGEEYNCSNNWNQIHISNNFNACKIFLSSIQVHVVVQESLNIHNLRSDSRQTISPFTALLVDGATDE